MSIIAIKITKNEILFGHDDQTTRGLDKMSTSGNGLSKIYQIGDSYLGAAGLVAVSEYFRRFIKNLKPNNQKLKTPFTEDDFADLILDFQNQLKEITGEKALVGTEENAFIFVHDQKAFLFEPPFLILEITDFYAIGSGSTSANAAHEAFRQIGREDDLEGVLKATCKIDLFCLDPVTVHKIPKK
jgi:ATP-dependent protease HslVU (ClpYQ) peptidase subunit